MQLFTNKLLPSEREQTDTTFFQSETVANVT